MTSEGEKLFVAGDGGTNLPRKGRTRWVPQVDETLYALGLWAALHSLET